MKIIKPSSNILEQPSGLDGVFKQIELAGRTCYKSLDKITESSAKEFVERMIKSNHTAMLEHGTIYLKIPYKTDFIKVPDCVGDYINNKYSDVNRNYEENNSLFDLVTTNYRVIIENHWEDDLKYICEPTDNFEKRITVRFTTSIGVSREFNRHRVNSIAEQSTRYCNYSKDKFGNEITFIKPSWCSDEMLGSWISIYRYDENGCRVSLKNKVEEIFIEKLLDAEKSYFTLINNGWPPQQAREILPLNTATELIHTASIKDWKHFFDLRVLGKTGEPHPMAKEVALPLYEEFLKRAYI